MEERNSSFFFGGRGSDPASGWERIGRGLNVVDGNLNGFERSKYWSEDMLPWVSFEERCRALILLGDGGGVGSRCWAAIVSVWSLICAACEW